MAFAPVVTRAAPRQVDTRLFGASDPLATEGEWSAFLDQDNTGMVYYFNTKTGESRWDAPTDTFPAVKMDDATRKLAREKRLQYVEQMSSSGEDEPKKKGFLASILDKPQEKEVDEVVVEEESEEPNWFDGLFDIKPAEPETVESTPVKKKEEKPAKKEKPAKATKEPDDETGGGFLSSLKQKEKPVKEEEPVKAKEESGDESGGGFLSGLKKKETPVKKEGPVKKEAPVKATKETEDEVTGGFLSSLFSRNGAVNGKRTSDKPLDVADKVFTNGDIKVVELDTASFVRAHPAKMSWGGEDAVFVNGRSFGVFDGVSGADKLDGVPLFSYTLAKEMKRTLNPEGAQMKEMINCLGDAAEFANRAATGASTAIVASIGQDDFLRVLNLGDCALYVIRNNKVVAKSREIVHYFDCPYQLSEDSPDRAQDGTKLNFEVIPGDVIVMGSDGVFDNLDEETICETVASSPQRSSVIAKRIVDVSRKVSLDDDAATPYAKLAKRNGFEDFATGRGGKLDDVSCVVVRCT